MRKYIYTFYFYFYFKIWTKKKKTHKNWSISKLAENEERVVSKNGVKEESRKGFGGKLQKGIVGVFKLANGGATRATIGCLINRIMT